MTTTLSQASLMQAFQGTNHSIPVWFFRQAGRYLPQYRAIREKHTLTEMFQNPDIVTEVTCLPVKILNVDAAILFADILTLPGRMGFKINFDKSEGPVIANPVQSSADIKKIRDFEDLDYIAQAVEAVNRNLSQTVPLIGFAGSPFTVACYLIEGGSSTSFNKTLKLMHAQPTVFHQLMEKLTINTIDYLNLQKNAGIHVFQVFDTWAGILTPNDYLEFVLPYVRMIFAKVDLPSIYYIKNGRHLLSLIEAIEFDFLSVCSNVLLGEDLASGRFQRGIQGNLHPSMLYADDKVLGREVMDIVGRVRMYKKFIFNLSQGLYPDVDWEKLRFVVQKVHEMSWKRE